MEKLDKLSLRKSPIVLQGKPLPEPTEYDHKVEVITSYVEKFAAIANRPVTPKMYEIYLEALDDLELRQLRKGLEECLRCCEKFPWPGEIRQFCEDEV